MRGDKDDCEPQYCLDWASIEMLDLPTGRNTPVESARTSEIVRFGVFELDLKARELRRNGRTIKLQEQPFQILSLLLEHPCEVVTQEQVIAKLWPDGTVVEYEHSIRTAVRKLRHALDDDADTPRYVETLPRRGYRFIYPVNGFNTSPGVEKTTSGDEVRKRPRWFGWVTAIVSLVALTAATLFAFNVFRLRDRVLGSTPILPIRSLAVLPLANLSGDPAQEYFSDGMTDALITDLSQIGSLKVISRTSSMQYKQTRKSLPQIARELNVDAIVEGTVQRSGDRARISAQLIHAASDKHLWANSYDRDMGDVFALERDLAQEIARQVQARLSTENQAQLAPPRPVNPKALEAYLQANYHLQKADLGTRDKEFRTAGEYFQHAIDVAPDFALAYVGLAEAHNVLYWPSSEDFNLMRRAAEKAVALDPASSEARTELGVTKWEDWDWSGAEEEYRRAITLNPNNALAHDSLGDYLDAMGRLEESWKEHEIAQELDPNQDHLSIPLARRGEYDRSIELVQKTLESRPKDATMRWLLAEVYSQKGMYKEWVREFGEAWSLQGFPESVGRIQQAFAVSGYTGARRQEARELEGWAASKRAYLPCVIADAYTASGEKDRAFYWLRQGVDHRHMAVADILQWFKIDPELAPLHSDPRFKDLLRRAGLPL
jgi:TolB-like protein/DNA-binding winged helix-turn-helix (wHTH) protein